MTLVCENRFNNNISNKCYAYGIDRICNTEVMRDDIDLASYINKELGRNADFSNEEPEEKDSVDSLISQFKEELNKLPQIANSNTVNTSENMQDDFSNAPDYLNNNDEGSNSNILPGDEFEGLNNITQNNGIAQIMPLETTDNLSKPCDARLSYRFDNICNSNSLVKQDAINTAVDNMSKTDEFNLDDEFTRQTMIEAINHYHEQLDNYGIKVTLPNDLTTKSTAELSSLMNNYKTKLDKKKTSETAEEILDAISRGLEHKFDGTKSYLGGALRPNLKGFHTSVKVQNERNRAELSSIFEPISKYIPPIVRLLVGYVVNGFICSYKNNLRNDDEITDLDKKNEALDIIENSK
jgi:hypothetical protein